MSLGKQKKLRYFKKTEQDKNVSNLWKERRGMQIQAKPLTLKVQLSIKTSLCHGFSKKQKKCVCNTLTARRGPRIFLIRCLASLNRASLACSVAYKVLTASNATAWHTMYGRLVM
eukprot:209178-Pelagomonas_calceolata.AAC.2